MISYEPNQRPTIEEILSDPWMQEINDLNDEERNALENEVRNEFEIRQQQIQQIQQNQQIQPNQQIQQNNNLNNNDN